MKTLRLLGLLLIAGVLFSCEKDIEKDNVKQEVVFGIEHVAPFLKDGHPDAFDIPCPEDLNPVTAHIKIEGIETPFTPDVFFVDGKLYTQSIMLDPGTYTVEKFLLKNDGGDIIMATPMAGSEYAEYVDTEITFQFVVDAFVKKEVYVEVLCFMEADYTNFGFIWFEIGRIVVHEIPFFGDFCMKDASEYAESYYALQSGFPGEGYFDAKAIFQIVVKRNGEEVLNSPFSNVDENGVIVNQPLLVQYPMDLNETNTYELELWIYVKVGDNYEYVHFHTWTLEDDEEIPTDDFGVVDFVLGSCAYMPADETLVLPPYHNLPLRATVSIFAEEGSIYDNGAYWDLTVVELFPSGSYDFPPADGEIYLGWCGDATTPLSSGTYDFFVYSSLNNSEYYRPWPAGLEDVVTLEDLAQVNWLFNNLTKFGYPALTDMFVHEDDFSGVTNQQGRDLQHAIWMLLGTYPADPGWPLQAQGGGPVSADAYDMYNAANDKGDFVPLPGGYAAVLMVVDDDGVPNFEEYQLVFTVVDP